MSGNGIEAKELLFPENVFVKLQCYQSMLFKAADIAYLIYSILRSGCAIVSYSKR